MLLALPITTTPALSAPDCQADSLDSQSTLLELYTSEGCSSCPPADNWLATIHERYPTVQLVPLSLHVPYWDHIGWKDPYANVIFEKRQRALARTEGVSVYTPQFFINGHATGNRSLTSRLNAYLDAAAKQKSDTRIQLDVTKTQAQQLRADMNAQTSANSHVLYLVITESHLTDHVTRGENAGVMLRNSHVVRRWIGPLAFNSRELVASQTIELDPEWRQDQLNIIAFVEHPRQRKVVQTVQTGPCLQG